MMEKLGTLGMMCGLLLLWSEFDMLVGGDECGDRDDVLIEDEPAVPGEFGDEDRVVVNEETVPPPPAISPRLPASPKELDDEDVLDFFLPFIRRLICFSHILCCLPPLEVPPGLSGGFGMTGLLSYSNDAG